MPGFDGSSIFPALLFSAALVGGTAITYACGRQRTLLWRLAAGICIGLAALGLLGFTLAMQFGLRGAVILATAALVASPALFLLSGEPRVILKSDISTALRSWRNLARLERRATAVRLVAFGAVALLLWRVAARAMVVTEAGVFTGVSHNQGDLPFHLAAVNRFLNGNFPPEHPSFAGVPFTYPFLADFVGAMFVATGLTAEAMTFWSALLLCGVVAVLLHQLTLDFTGNATAAWLAPMLAFFSGGLGWWRFVEDVTTRGAVTLIARVPHDYTMTADQTFRWGNLLTSVLVTQRGMLLGLPLALVVMSCWWAASRTDSVTSEQRNVMTAAGVIAGLLPLVHAHSFAVMVGVGSCLAAISSTRRIWIPFLLSALAIGLPQIWWLGQSSAVDSLAFVRWAFGWDRGDQNAVVFWLKNTGAFIPLLIIALGWRGNRPVLTRRMLSWYLPFTLCFVVPNLIALAPWIWDNIKVLLYWFIASVPVVSLLLVRIGSGGRLRLAAAGALCLVLTLSGGLDVWRVASGAFEARIFTREDILFADRVSATTPPDSLILHAPVHNHAVFLSGRRSLMGYPGHLWSHGLDYRQREADIRTIYGGGPAASRLLAGYDIDYIVVSPAERSIMPVNEAFLSQYEREITVGTYALYRVARKNGSDDRPGSRSE